MTSFTISDSDLDKIKDQVVIVTGASSGIGLATTKRLVQHGAKVFASDINPLPSDVSSNPNVAFMKVDVRSWKEQSDMFKAAKEKFGAVNHVFANAGISPTVTLLEDEVDENGDLLPPNLKTLDINLTGVIYTVKLGIHHIKASNQPGSIVMTGSGSSFSRFSPTDYTTSKHAVLGLLRSLYCNLHPALPIRINAIGPSWTATGIVPQALIDAVGAENVQSPDVVARSVVNLMAGQAHGEFIYSDKGRFWDLENGDKGLNALTHRMLGGEYTEEENAVTKMKSVLKKMAEDAGVAAKAEGETQAS